MELEEYKKRLLEINNRYNAERSELAHEYAMSNNTYQLGDIFTDHIGSMRVEAITVHMNYGQPSCAYYGLELKKDGTPTKKGNKRYGWQMNDINKKTVSQ